MESCLAVEKDINNALGNFSVAGEHIDCVLSHAITQIQNLKQELSEVPESYVMSQTQMDVVKETVGRCKDVIQRIASGHRESHACVSRVGKSIDRSFIAELMGAVPRDALFSAAEQRPLIDKAVAQHLYRQGLDGIADILVSEAKLEGDGGGSPLLSGLHRVVEALTEKDPGPALVWAEENADALHHSQLPFKLHRLAFLLAARNEGPLAAVLYAQKHFPQFVNKYEKEIQRTMCLLAYESNSLPPSYTSLRDEVLWPDAIEVFLKDAFTLLGLPPMSPLQSAVSVGSHVLPALLDIRLKMANTHQHHAWAAKDELPVSVHNIVEMEGGGHHSVFACPILRQQGSEQNPPMRLLCGHVISKDALTKLCQGIRLKCPYCPMEQTQNEARLIYF